ncbi:MAG: DUF433 domain-containing protein [Thermomicrobiales bacterium]
MEQAISQPTNTATEIVTRDPRILSGALIVAGQRIPLPFVISLGDTPEGHREAQRNYPSLTIEHIEAAFTYVRTHPDLDIWS